MTKKPIKTAKTTLFRLIEAGFLSRQALLQPLQENRLEPGDDAILLALKENLKQSEPELSRLTGLPQAALASRLRRLKALRFIISSAPRDDDASGVELTELGIKTCAALAEHWQRLDEALIGELGKKDRKKLRKILKRFVTLLSLPH